MFIEDVKYFADLNRIIYLENRKSCGRKPKFLTCEKFLNWVDKKILEENWSVDACVGYAKRNKLFNDNEIPSVKSMYNWIDKGLMKAKNIDLELKLKRKTNKNSKKNRKNKMALGESIETRPKEIETREEFGDWEMDTVIGSEKKTDPVIITLTERKTRYELIIKIDSKTNKTVKEGLSFLKETNQLKEQVFKTITSDNGLEF
uniref:IS30 family transposase n=1 Tax=Anaerococcus lactolyticus TaxID=33032 RepID=UPI00288B0401|nr:IS30 family transposase [Anaerococcus lactolyticus]